MVVKIFVSSTSQDLKKVCRIPAIKIIDSYHPNAIAEAMEKWNEDHIDPIVVCKGKLEGSTHFMGIFAFRRGWVPRNVDLGNRSITEAEYDWALELKKIPYILIPSNDSEIGKDLQRDALNQSEAEKVEQKEFLRRVQKNGIVNFFVSPDEFEESVRDKVKEWIRKDGQTLLVHGRELWKNSETDKLKNLTVSDISEENDFLQPISPYQIGRLLHILAFNNANKIIRRKSKYSTVCYLVSGADGNGHRELIRELRSELNPAHQFFTISCLSMFEQVSATSLYEQIWESINNQNSNFLFDSMIEDIKKKLKFQDIVFCVDNVEEFGEGPMSFVENFWIPLNAHLNTQTSHRLIIFASFKKSDISDFGDHLHFIANSPRYFDTEKIIALPELVLIESDDIRDWFEENHPNMSSMNISKLTTMLLEKSDKNPEKLYKLLNSMQRLRK